MHLALETFISYKESGAGSLLETPPASVRKLIQNSEPDFIVLVWKVTFLTLSALTIIEIIPVQLERQALAVESIYYNNSYSSVLSFSHNISSEITTEQLQHKFDVRAQQVV